MTTGVSMSALEGLGYSPAFAEALGALDDPELRPARVVRTHRGRLRVRSEDEERVAEVRGRLRHAARGGGDLPVVGDWVAVRLLPREHRAVVEAVLPRRTAFVRKAAGEPTGEQVLAANVDTVFVVAGLDRDFNPRRLERYLLLAWESGARPVVVLNKADLCADPPGRMADTFAVAPGVDVHVVCGKDAGTLGVLDPYLLPGRTVAFLGSSGVGKSTLINRLLGADVQTTRAVREQDDRGRHTTTHRELFVLPGGGLVIDTPGIRELQLWTGETGVEAVFEEVAALAASCRFRDCRHESEPGCAVRAAVEDGRLLPERLASLHKLQAELQHSAVARDAAARAEQNRRWKIIHRAAKKHRPRE
jgi:ribosome biogenesis GTPase